MRDIDLAAYHPLCALASTFKQNELQRAAVPKTTGKWKFLVGNNAHHYEQIFRVRFCINLTDGAVFLQISINTHWMI